MPKYCGCVELINAMRPVSLLISMTELVVCQFTCPRCLLMMLCSVCYKDCVVVAVVFVQRQSL